jgi:aminoglycoside 3'-phosphotransferase-2
VTRALPPGWGNGFAITEITNGKSGAAVFRLGDTLFAKSEPITPLAELPGEILRLRWLGSTGLPCPKIVDTCDFDGRHWLLMTAVPGQDLAHAQLPPETAVTMVAHALRQLHALDPATCPFDHRASIRIAAATARFEAGLYDGDDFAQGPADHATLLATCPSSEDLVVTHGDACFPNFMAENGRFSGFIDCGRLGVADRYQDLVLTRWSLEHNFGAQHLGTFLAAYGVADLDEKKLRWYQLLDEFF